jgi:hypothetical protein
MENKSTVVGVGTVRMRTGRHLQFFAMHTARNTSSISGKTMLALSARKDGL